MADSNITVLDSGGVARAVDAQTIGTDFQQTVTIGDGVNAGRVAAVTADNSLKTINNASTTETGINVASSITSVQILAANANRRGAIIYNDSANALFIRYGTTAASLTAFTTKIAAGAAYFLDVPLWTGAIQGIWQTSASGAARGSDLSA